MCIIIIVLYHGVIFHDMKECYFDIMGRLIDVALSQNFSWRGILSTINIYIYIVIVGIVGVLL